MAQNFVLASLLLVLGNTPRIPLVIRAVRDLWAFPYRKQHLNTRLKRTQPGGCIYCATRLEAGVCRNITVRLGKTPTL